MHPFTDGVEPINLLTGNVAPFRAIFYNEVDIIMTVAKPLILGGLAFGILYLFLYFRK